MLGLHKKKTQVQDKDKEVNLVEPYEVMQWTKEFKCTEAQLRAAIKEVGHSANKIGEYIKNH